MVVVRKEYTRTRHTVRGLKIQNKKLIRRNVPRRYPAVGMTSTYRRIATSTSTTFRHELPEKTGGAVGSPFRRSDRQNKMKERIPNNPEAAKAVKPIPGFPGVPIPRRKDSIPA
jgi:hypothetical protein